MLKVLKYIVVTLVCLVLLIGVGGYIALKNIDFNRYKNIVEEKVIAATGRDFHIGDIQIKASLNPTVELKNVTLANAEWAKEKMMANIGAIDVGVALLPLLKGNYVVDTFVIKNAEINLEENKDGLANWTFEKKEQNEENTAEEKTSFNFSLIKSAHAEENVKTEGDVNDILSKLVIKQVALENVKINYIDKKAQLQSYDIKQLTLDENDDKNIDFKFNVNDGLYNGIGVLGALNLLDSENGYPVKANVNVMGINVITDATLFNVKNADALRFDAKVKAKGFLGKDSHYDEAADVAVKGDLKEIDAVINSVRLAGNEISGTANAVLTGKVPSVKANLSSDKIDLDSFAEPKKVAFNIDVIKSAEATTMVPNEVIPYDALYSVNADVDMTVAQIIKNKQPLVRDLSLNAKVSQGVAAVKVVNAKVAKGDLKADAVLNAANKNLNVNLNLVKLNLSDLLQIFDAQSDKFKFISGSDTDLYVKLVGTGNTYSAIAESMNGSLSLIVDQSEMHLGNVGMVKGNIFSQLWNALNLTKGNDNLNMQCAVVRADVKDGLAEFPNGIVVKADKFTVVANGKVNLKNDKLNISFKPFAGKITDTNIAKALSSLVQLKGTLQKPTIGVDTANAVKNIVGATMTGPVYLGAQMVMENDNSPCYTALKGTGYESRFPESTNIARSTGEGVGQAVDGSVDMVKDTAKVLFNMLSGKPGKDKENDAK